MLYTLDSRVALAGVPAEQYEGYRGTTEELLASLAEAMRARLDATWCIAESGLAGPTGSRFGASGRAHHDRDGGPVERVEVFETGLEDREANMVEFTTLTLRLLRDVLAGADA